MTALVSFSNSDTFLIFFSSSFSILFHFSVSVSIRNVIGIHQIFSDDKSDHYDLFCTTEYNKGNKQTNRNSMPYVLITNSH